MTVQTAADAAISDNNDVLPAWLKSSPAGTDMTASGDLAAMVRNGYLHDAPANCHIFALTTTMQNGTAVYVVKGS